MLKITPATSKAVGFKQNKVVPYPTMEEVRKAEEEENGVRLLTWFRYLKSATTEDEATILDEINRITVAAMKR